MNRQDAIKVLLRAGKRSDLIDAIARKAESAARGYAEIREDASRTDDYKRWALAVAASQANRALNDELEKMASRVVVHDRDDAGRVFGTVGISGDPASLVISRRDAGDRVAEISKTGELRDLLARATRSGDEVLARAVAERALEMGDAKTLEKFAEDRPNLDAAVERLWKAERADDDTFGHQHADDGAQARRARQHGLRLHRGARSGRRTWRPGHGRSDVVNPGEGSPRGCHVDCVG